MSKYYDTGTIKMRGSYEPIGRLSLEDFEKLSAYMLVECEIFPFICYRIENRSRLEDKTNIYCYIAYNISIMSEAEAEEFLCQGCSPDDPFVIGEYSSWEFIDPEYKDYE